MKLLAFRRHGSFNRTDVQIAGRSQTIPGQFVPRYAPPRGFVAAACTVFLSAVPDPAAAHVKWFAPYIVGAPPAPISQTLTDLWFWSAIALVLAFFLAARFIERTRVGDASLAVLDYASGPLWRRLDDFVRVMIGCFFIAIFSVGGVYLTPDLKTPSEWVSWVQLAIGIGIFSRHTMPLSAAGIVFLWILALQDYDLFHLLDYLALGLGAAIYLVLATFPDPHRRRHRFTVLRIAVSIALMWSSLEKFAYPNWFYPLVVEKPFLTFGLPRDAFIPMAGVAEFAMGFGLLWTPLVRRLSAVALLAIFTAAVFPFGRVDLIGHALIMAMLVAIAADQTREINFLPAIKRSLAAVPAGLTTALAGFAAGYWGLHLTIYGAGGTTGTQPVEPATHTYSREHPHGPMIGEGVRVGTEGADMLIPAAAAANYLPPSEATAAFEATMATMHALMMRGMRHPDPDVAFVLGMIPHHQGAIDMARVQLRYGSDQNNRAFAEQLIAVQQSEIDAMHDWLRLRGIEPPHVTAD